MQNPFQELADRLTSIESVLLELTKSATTSHARVETNPLNVDQAAELLGLSRQTVYDKIHSGTLPHVKKGNRIYFFREELIQWLKTGRQPTKGDLEAETKVIVKTNRTTRRMPRNRPTQ